MSNLGEGFMDAVISRAATGSCSFYMFFLVGILVGSLDLAFVQLNILLFPIYILR